MRFSSSAPLERYPGAAFAAACRPGRMLAAAIGTTPAGGASDSTAVTATTALTGTIGNLPVRYDITARLLASDRAARTVHYRVRARERAARGDIDGLVVMHIAVAETGAHSGTLELSADLDARGQIARFGSQPLRLAVSRATDRLAAALADGAEVGSGGQAPVESVTAGRPGPAEQSGPAGWPWRRVIPLAAAALSVGVVIIRSTRKAGDGGAPRHH